MPQRKSHSDPKSNSSIDTNTPGGNHRNIPQGDKIAQNGKGAIKLEPRKQQEPPKTILENELEDIKQLQQISNHVTDDKGSTADLYHLILRLTMEMMHADFASLQLLNPKTKELQLLVSENFHPDSAKFWNCVNADSTSTCGMALAGNLRVIIEDLRHMPFEMDKGDYQAYNWSGIVAVQSTPLVSRNGKQVGMISTHWKKPHKPSERELGLYDIIARQVADLIERKKAAEDLRKSEEKYRTLFNSIDEGVVLLEILYNDVGEPADSRCLETNKVFKRQMGPDDWEGKTVLELFPDSGPQWLAFCSKVARTGEAARMASHLNEIDRWYSAYASSVGGAGSPLVAVVFDDITERKQNETRQEFLLNISDKLGLADSFKDVQATVTNSLREHYDAGWCYYVQWEEEKKAGVVLYESKRDDLLSLAGTHDVSGVPEFLKVLKAGQILNVSDGEGYKLLTPRMRERYTAAGVRSMLVASRVRQGRLISSLIIGDSKIRNWSRYDESLLADVAERTWPAVERARAETALRENETRLNIILEGIGEAFYALDREWRFLFASRAALKMWGKELDEVIGRIFLECFPQAAGSLSYEAHQRVMTTGITERFESVSPVLNRRIEILIAPTLQGGLSVSFGDIEDSMRSEEALRESEKESRGETARLQATLKSISDAVYIGDASGITLANQAALDQLGYSTYDELNKNIGTLSVEIQTRDAETDEVIPPERQAFARALAGEIVTQNVSIRKRKDGSERIVRSAASPVEVDGKIVAAVAVNTDITEQWRTAAALHESEQKLKEFNESLEQQVKDRTRELLQSRDSLRSILDTTLVQMSILEAVRDEQNQIIDFEIKLVNKELEKETGRNDLVGKFYATEYPGIKQMGVFDLIVKTVETGEPQAAEYFYTYEGFHKWFSSMFIKLNDGVVSTNMDITNRKLAEEQVKNFAIRQKELEEKQQQEMFRAVLDTQEVERKRIAENLHNSLGQMLYAIKLGLGAVNKSQLAENARQDLKNVDKLLSEAINETRRLSHELMPTILEDFGLKVAVEDICRKLSDKVRIKCRFKGLTKKMDRHIETAVYRMVQELVMNVVKHSDAAKALVSVEIGKSAILISVQDNGKGFNVIKEKRDGIGLKTIRNSVNLLNGHIHIVSKPGADTIINIDIPYKSNK
jgi:PAS domain S-box-containing protein